MKKLLLTGILAACVSINTQADTILGVYVGAYAWQTGITGDIEPSDGSGKFSIKDSNVDDETNSVFYVALEHPLPVLPNISLTQTNLEFKDLDLDLTHTDATLYYEVLDNIVSLDFGFTARMYAGEVKNSISGTEDIDDTIALAFLRVRGDLPFTGLAIGAEVNTGQDSTTDANIFLEYETPIGLGFTGGFRSLTTDIETSKNTTAELDIDGGYISIFFHL